MTPNQRKQFNTMLATLKKIAFDYQTPSQIRRTSERDYGLEYDEAIEMIYENIQEEARHASKGVRSIELTAKSSSPKKTKSETIENTTTSKNNRHD